jgi:hypothetical protein
MVLAACSLALPAGALPTSVTQRDWSGGPGEPGPVLDWGDSFDGSVDAAWRSIPGQLALASAPHDPGVRTVVAPTASHPNRVGAGDLDGDGRIDLLTPRPVIDPQGPPRGAIYRWERNASGTWLQYTVTEDFYGALYLDSADVDGDGDLDIIATAYYGVADPPPPPPAVRNGRYAWFENVNGDATVWTQHLVGEMYWGARFIDAADVDGDGDLDLLGASELTDGIYEQDGDVTWFENVDGTGLVWTAHDLATDIDSAFDVHAADIDGDGDVDVVASTYEVIFWWENDAGDGSAWTRRSVTPTFWGAGHFDVGDVDGDGDVDLLGSGYNTTVLVWWRNLDGQGLSWDAIAVDALLQLYAVRLADLDGDGDLDAAATNRTGNETGGAQWFENTSGDGLAWQTHPLGGPLLPSRPYPAIGDADGDGGLDVIVSFEDFYNDNTQQLAYYHITDFLAFGELTSSVLDGGKSPNWYSLEWDALVPTGTRLTVEARSGGDPGSLGSWIIVPSSGVDLSGLIDPAGRYFQYRLQLRSGDPAVSPIVQRVQVRSGDPTGAPDASVPAGGLALQAPRPNPFAGGVALRYSLPTAGPVALDVVDVRGRRVARLVDAIQEPGAHAVTWDGRGDDGVPTGSGVFFARLAAQGETRTVRLIHLR